MARATRLAARFVPTIALAAAVSCVPSVASARGRPLLRIAIGEVAAVEGGAAAARALSRALAEAIEAQPDADLAPMRRAELVLRGSVVRIERSAVAGGLEVRCEVSVIVADARGGAIRAMLRGRGGARGDGDPARLSDDALRAAVRGALRPLSSGHARLALAR
jgi:hypothetical protein